MEFPAHIVFSCLLVCQPAIFVDSKRDGTGAAHGRKGFRMKRAELDRRIANGETLDDIVPALMDDGADITSYDDLKHLLPISPRGRRFRWMDGSATTLG